MSIVKTAFSNSLKNIARSRTVNGLSLSIISFTLLIFGIFNFISYSISDFNKNFSKNIEAIFYLKDNADKVSVDELYKQIKESSLVEKCIYRTKSQSGIEFSREFPELKHILSEYKQSPFPSSLDITFRFLNNNTKIISFIKEIEKLRIIESKQVNLDWAEKINKLKKLISFLGIFLSGILIFISAFIIFNVIKINIYYRKDEISILKLVGATNWYIKTPFIIEGAVLGFFGSILASIILFAILKLAPAYAGTLIELSKGLLNFSIIPFSIFVKMVILGLFIGLFSSFFSIRKYMIP